MSYSHTVLHYCQRAITYPSANLKVSVYLIECCWDNSNSSVLHITDSHIQKYARNNWRDMSAVTQPSTLAAVGSPELNHFLKSTVSLQGYNRRPRQRVPSASSLRAKRGFKYWTQEEKPDNAGEYVFCCKWPVYHHLFFWIVNDALHNSRSSYIVLLTHGVHLQLLWSLILSIVFLLVQTLLCMTPDKIRLFAVSGVMTCVMLYFMSSLFLRLHRSKTNHRIKGDFLGNWSCTTVTMGFLNHCFDKLYCRSCSAERILYYTCTLLLWIIPFHSLNKILSHIQFCC